MEQNTLKRLIFIKYLYEKGVEQSYKSYPASQMSLLTFHDAIELFLIFAYLHLGGLKHINDIQFMKYWKEILDLPNGVEISQQPSVGKLNDARVNLKHRGNFTSDLDIESFRATATSFFNENTEKIFGIEFSEISIVDVVKNQEIKAKLKKAERFLNDNKPEESIKEISDAFYEIINDYESKTTKFLGWNNPFEQTDLDLDLKSTCKYVYDDDEFSDAIITNFQKIEVSIYLLQETVKLMSWGINYYDYLKFRSIIPPFSLPGQQKLFEKEFKTKEYGEHEVKFCFDFVISLYLTLEQFDLNKQY